MVSIWETKGVKSTPFVSHKNTHKNKNRSFFKGTFLNHWGVVKVDTIYKESLKECLKRSLKRIFIGPHRKSPLKTRLFLTASNTR